MEHSEIKQKITINDLFNCGDLTYFIASIVKILPFHGASGSMFFTCEVDGVRFLTKMVMYLKSAPEIYGQDLDDAINQADAEINILLLFKEMFIEKNITPCIVEPIFITVCDSIVKMTPRPRECAKMVEAADDEQYIQHMLCAHADKIAAGLAIDKCAFMVLERCDMTLQEYLSRTDTSPATAAVFKSLLFQVLYTLCAILQKYPQFRHGDLHADNVMLKINTSYNVSRMQYHVFVVDGERFYVPYYGIIVKIIDFGWASVPEAGIVSSITKDKVVNTWRTKHDMLFLMHWIHNVVTRAGTDRYGYIIEILEKLDPTMMFITHYAPDIKRQDKKVPSPRQMIHNQIWDEYKESVPPERVLREYTKISTKK